MDEKTLKRIYDPYFTTKDKHLGTGLGLSVVRKITEDLNGRIGVKTYLGKGTRFELTFPEARSITPEEENHRPRIGKGSGKILFVDDEQDIAALSVHLLERLGYSVDALTHPLEALEKLTKAPDGYDLVITDMTMPKMTGIRLAENIKAIRPDIPIILCTGFNKMEIQDQIENRNINAILKKPVHLREFSETITRLMNRRKTPQPFTGRDLPLVPFMTAVPFNEVTSRPALKE
jgi:CheY-like chemotaxis protein